MTMQSLLSNSNESVTPALFTPPTEANQLNQAAEIGQSQQPEQETLTGILASMVEACDIGEDNLNLRDCLIGEANKRTEDGLAVYLITSPSCGGCADSKEDLAPLLNSGQIRELDSSSDLAYSLMEQAGSPGMVPMLVIVGPGNQLLGELDIYLRDEVTSSGEAINIDQ